MNIINKIKNLTKGQFGGFGEYVVKSFYKDNYNIKSMHKEQTDFIINGIHKDVKSRRFLDKKYDNIRQRYSGKRHSGVEYITLYFYKDYAVISENEIMKVVFDWTEIENLYSEYKLVKKIPNKNVDSKDNYAHHIKEYIKSINSNLKVRVILRDEITDTLWSNSNQAHNSYPNENQMKKYDCTCYLSVNRATDVVRYAFLIPHNQKIIDTFLTVEPYNYVKNKGAKKIFDIRKMKEDKKYEKYFYNSEGEFIHALNHFKR